MSPALFPVASMDAFLEAFLDAFFDMNLDAFPDVFPDVFLPMNFISTDMGRQIHVCFQLCSTHKTGLTIYGKKNFDKDTSFISIYLDLSQFISDLSLNSSSHIEHFAIYGKNAPKNPQKPSAHKSKHSAYGQIFYFFLILILYLLLFY